jgi:hypothetical protein
MREVKMPRSRKPPTLDVERLHRLVGQPGSPPPRDVPVGVSWLGSLQKNNCHMHNSIISHHQPDVPMQCPDLPWWSSRILGVPLVGERNGLRWRGVIQTPWINNAHHIHPIHVHVSHLQRTKESLHDLSTCKIQNKTEIIEVLKKTRKA